MKQATDFSVPILATACIPWNEREEILESVFRRSIGQLYTEGYENLYLFGTAGEGYAITDSLFGKIAGIFMEETEAVGMTGIRQLGVIGLSSMQVRQRIEIGLDLGFTHFQISLPCWGPLNDGEVDRFFDDVTGSYPQASFLHYNTPRAGRALSGPEYARLYAAHPNLTATKTGGHTATSLMSLFSLAPQMLHFVTELDYAAGCLLGFKPGLLVSVSAVNPYLSMAFFHAGQRGDMDELRALTADINLIREKVVGCVGQSRGHMDGAFDKFYSRLLDPEFPLRLLSPYCDAGEQRFETFSHWIKNEMAEWRRT